MSFSELNHLLNLGVSNLASVRKDICAQAVYYLSEWHDEMMLTSVDGIDPLWTVMKEGGRIIRGGNLRIICHDLKPRGVGMELMS